MTVTTDSITAGTHCGVGARGIGAHIKQLVGRAIFRFTRPGLEPVFGRGLGDDFTPEVVLALTAANQASADRESRRPGNRSITPGQ